MILVLSLYFGTMYYLAKKIIEHAKMFEEEVTDHEPIYSVDVKKIDQ